MPRMTFTKDFIRDLDERTSCRWLAGGTYDVPADWVDVVTADEAGALEAAAAAAVKNDGASGVG